MQSSCWIGNGANFKAVILKWVMLCIETLEHVTWFWPFIVLKTCCTRHYDALFWSSIWELRNEAGPLYLVVYLLFLCVYVSAGVSVENAGVSICILSELFSGSLCLSLMILFLSWCIFFLTGYIYQCTYVWQSVGFIGLGNMGFRMASNLMKAGYKMAVHDV